MIKRRGFFSGLLLPLLPNIGQSCRVVTNRSEDIPANISPIQFIELKKSLTPLENTLFYSLMYQIKYKPRLHTIEALEKENVVVFSFLYYMGQEPVREYQYELGERKMDLGYVLFPRERYITLTHPMMEMKPPEWDSEKLNRMFGFNVFPSLKTTPRV